MPENFAPGGPGWAQPIVPTASGVLNTSRQVGGALAIAVFGTLLAQPATVVQGVRTSLLIAAGSALAVAAASLLLRPARITRYEVTTP